MMRFFKKALPPPAVESGLLRHNNKEIPYSVVRSKRRRRTVSLSVKPSTGLRLLVPMRITGLEIKRILHRRAEWISRQFQVQQQENRVSRLEFEAGQGMPYMGVEYKLVFNAQSPVTICIADDMMEVNALKPREALQVFYKKQAQEWLQLRLCHWAGVLGAKNQSFRLSNARRLWGSCSARNGIRINWRIIMAPEAVIDYLLVHELCHIRHKNHSDRFWGAVENALPDYKQRQKILRAQESGWLARFR